MQSQFTDKARTALQLAERAARRMRQGYVGTEHILLGLLEEGTGTAARVLAENGANEQEIRDMIRDLIAPVSPVPVKERDGYSPRAMAILEEDGAVSKCVFLAGDTIGILGSDEASGTYDSRRGTLAALELAPDGGSL